MIREATYEQIMQQRFKRSSTILYFYTPLCGTCKLARQMLEVVLATLDDPERQEQEVLACNLNQMPSVAKEWEITSVPCLTFLHDGKIVEKLYSFQSVDNIYHKILNFNQNTQKSSG